MSPAVPAENQPASPPQPLAQPAVVAPNHVEIAPVVVSKQVSRESAPRKRHSATHDRDESATAPAAKRARKRGHTVPQPGLIGPANGAPIVEFSRNGTPAAVLVPHGTVTLESSKCGEHTYIAWTVAPFYRHICLVITKNPDGSSTVADCTKLLTTWQTAAPEASEYNREVHTVVTRQMQGKDCHVLQGKWGTIAATGAAVRNSRDLYLFKSMAPLEGKICCSARKTRNEHGLDEWKVVEPDFLSLLETHQAN